MSCCLLCILAGAKLPRVLQHVCWPAGCHAGQVPLEGAVILCNSDIVIRFGVLVLLLGVLCRPISYGGFLWPCDSAGLCCKCGS